MSGLFDSLMNNKGKTAAVGVGGLLGALIGGTGGVQKAVRNAAAVGGGALLAGLAYDMYSKWRNNGSSAPVSGQSQSNRPAASAPAASDDPFAEFNGSDVNPQDEKNGELLLRAMIYAARADGHIDRQEQDNIMAMAKELFPSEEINGVIRNMLKEPLDPKVIAQSISNPAMAADVYKLSAAAIIADNDAEKQYLDSLADALGISVFDRDALDGEAASVRAQLTAK